jgi:hypothetical protein
MMAYVDRNMFVWQCPLCFYLYSKGTRSNLEWEAGHPKWCFWRLSSVSPHECCCSTSIRSRPLPYKSFYHSFVNNNTRKCETGDWSSLSQRQCTSVCLAHKEERRENTIFDCHFCISVLGFIKSSLFRIDDWEKDANYDSHLFFHKNIVSYDIKQQWARKGATETSKLRHTEEARHE